MRHLRLLAPVVRRVLTKPNQRLLSMGHAGIRSQPIILPRYGLWAFHSLPLQAQTVQTPMPADKCLGSLRPKAHTLKGKSKEVAAPYAYIYHPLHPACRPS